MKSHNFKLDQRVLFGVEVNALAHHYHPDSRSVSKDSLIRSLIIGESAEWLQEIDGFKWAGFVWSDKGNRRHFATLNPRDDLIWTRYKASEWSERFINYLEQATRLHTPDFKKIDHDSAEAWAECDVRGKSTDHFVRPIRGMDLGFSSSEIIGWLVIGTTTSNLSSDVIDSINKRINMLVAENSRVLSMSRDALQDIFLNQHFSSISEDFSQLAIPFSRMETTQDSKPQKMHQEQMWTDEVLKVEFEKARINWHRWKSRGYFRGARALIDAGYGYSEQQFGTSPNHSFAKKLGRLYLGSTYYHNDGTVTALVGLAIRVQNISDVFDLTSFLDAASKEEFPVDQKTEIIVFCDFDNKAARGLNRLLSARCNVNWNLRHI